LNPPKGYLDKNNMYDIFGEQTGQRIWKILHGSKSLFLEDKPKSGSNYQFIHEDVVILFCILFLFEVEQTSRSANTNAQDNQEE
jgi:hypothetical protein